ncbi:FliC/FljB family flagellin [Schauerella aestuarii]|uniref:FliC/FljB family flagellin n=1 Tax=Schauerella aestuarii TaxID=2511204 RepID=UPI00136AFC68|nr:FliC/FljB family flagellin [Achromobacter aestuarii]MYZ44918.1 FliC/FljB family flagellin [Achromobacter aestuarii]
MAVINTNYLSLVAQNNLNKSQNSLGTAIERLSSGFRINSAKDDAAGQAIANRFTANIKGLSQASRNANEGISVAQTTEGALNEINTNLQRIRELSVQAANGSNSASDLKSIQGEIEQRLAEIDRVSDQTQFNGVKVLASDQTLKIQVGANDSETIDIDLQKIDAGTLKLSGFNVSGPVGTTSTAGVADALKKAYGDTTKVTSVTLAGTTGLADLGSTPPTPVVVADEKGNLFAEVTVEPDATREGVKGGDKIYVAIDTSKGTLNAAGTTLEFTAADPVDFGGVTSFASTGDPLKKLDAALSQVDSLRSSLGAVQNRFQSTVANLNNTVNNLSAARSRIEDADYATEVSNMSRSQILQQAGTSVLSQANQVPQSVLSLLQ